MASNLVTRQEYKTYVGIRSDNQDTEIDVLIPRVSQLVKSYCNQSFVDYVDDAKTEIFSGASQQYLLKETPVIAIQSVELSEDYGQQYTQLVQYVDWIWDAESNLVHLLDTPVRKPNAYKVTYTAGYEVLPADLKLVVLDLITYYIKNDAISHKQKTNTSGSLQLEYLTNGEFPSHIARILNLYKSNWD